MVSTCANICPQTTPRLHTISEQLHTYVSCGGFQPCLNLPYEGPFHIASKTPQGIRVPLSGQGVKLVTLAKIKPAHIVSQELYDEEAIIPEEQVLPPPPARWQPRPRRPDRPQHPVSPSQRPTCSRTPYHHSGNQTIRTTLGLLKPFTNLLHLQLDKIGLSVFQRTLIVIVMMMATSIPKYN